MSNRDVLMYLNPLKHPKLHHYGYLRSSMRFPALINIYFVSRLCYLNLSLQNLFKYFNKSLPETHALPTSNFLDGVFCLANRTSACEVSLDLHQCPLFPQVVVLKASWLCCSCSHSLYFWIPMHLSHYHSLLN